MTIDQNPTNRYVDWNPWHGCTKISPGCQFCYVYRQDERYGNALASHVCRKNQSFNLPIQKKRDGSYKIPSGKIIFTCFTSDFFLEDADEWRSDCWKMMKERRDCWFYFFTKRIHRFEHCVPEDWGHGYNNVLIGCSVENQAMADERLPVFNTLSIKHKSIIVAPLLEKINISDYLHEAIEMVSVSGESGPQARACDYDWMLNLRAQCVEKEVPFRFHQTGARLIKDGKMYQIKRKDQHSQARKAKIDYRIQDNFIPDSIFD